MMIGDGPKTFGVVKMISNVARVGLGVEREM